MARHGVGRVRILAQVVLASGGIGVRASDLADHADIRAPGAGRFAALLSTGIPCTLAPFHPRLASTE